jgi:hypothetical protein
VLAPGPADPCAAAVQATGPLAGTAPSANAEVLAAPVDEAPGRKYGCPLRDALQQWPAARQAPPPPLQDQQQPCLLSPQQLEEEQRGEQTSTEGATPPAVRGAMASAAPHPAVQRASPKSRPPPRLPACMAHQQDAAGTYTVAADGSQPPDRAGVPAADVGAPTIQQAVAEFSNRMAARTAAARAAPRVPAFLLAPQRSEGACGPPSHVLGPALEGPAPAQSWEEQTLLLAPPEPPLTPMSASCAQALALPPVLLPLEAHEASQPMPTPSTSSPPPMRGPRLVRPPCGARVPTWLLQEQAAAAADERRQQ